MIREEWIEAVKNGLLAEGWSELHSQEAAEAYADSEQEECGAGTAEWEDSGDMVTFILNEAMGW